MRAVLSSIFAHISTRSLECVLALGQFWNSWLYTTLCPIMEKYRKLWVALHGKKKQHMKKGSQQNFGKIKSHKLPMGFLAASLLHINMFCLLCNLISSDKMQNVLSIFVCWYSVCIHSSTNGQNCLRSQNSLICVQLCWATSFRTITNQTRSDS